MINHPDCYWCKLSIEENQCDDCINRGHKANAHTPTLSRMLGIICFHNKPFTNDPYDDSACNDGIE